MPTDDNRPDDRPLDDGGDLEARLIDEWDRLLPHQTDIGGDLLQRYAETAPALPRRRAISPPVLRRIDELADDHDLFLVRLAAWFHDAVYAIPPGQLTNEEASARLVRPRARPGRVWSRRTSTRSPGWSG